MTAGRRMRGEVRPDAAADLHTTVAARLRAHDQRYTTNRRALVEALVSAGGPLTLPEILAVGAGIPQSSAYRNLTILERAGVVHRIVTTDEFSRFELAEQLTDDHHHHLICSGCGRVADFAVPPELEQRLDESLDAVAAESGFELEHHRFDLVGRCPRCRPRRSGPP